MSKKKSAKPARVSTGVTSMPSDQSDASPHRPQAAILNGVHIRRLPKEVVAGLMRYVPQIPKRDWAAIREFVLDAVAIAADGTTVRPDRALMIVTPFARWAISLQGLPQEASAVFNMSVIEAYCDSLTISDGSVATYRSILRSVADRVAPAESTGPTRSYSRRQIQDPYNETELQRYRSWANGQPTATKTRQAKLLLSCGAGAGLRPIEITALRPQDLTIIESGITIHVDSTPPREVTILAEWEDMLLEAVSGIAPSAVAWGDTPIVSKNKNLVSNFAEHSAGAAPVASRLRTYWLVNLLNRRVHLEVIMLAAGFKRFDNLPQILKFTDKPGAQDARAQLRGGDYA